MDWLLHNFIADMYGPSFLLFYGAIVAVTFFACRLMIRKLDWTAALPFPPVPAEPDPYELAYLRDGENELARTVIFHLLQHNYLQIKDDAPQKTIHQTGHTPERRSLLPLEQSVFDWFKTPRQVDQIFSSDGLVARLRPYRLTYEQRLQNEKLLVTPEMRAGARRVMLLGLANVLVLSGYKIGVALAKGRHNLIFLLIGTAIAVFLVMRTARLPRLSERGRQYLDRMRLAFERLRGHPAGAKEERSVEAGATAAAVDPTLPLLVGLFGVTALAGTPYEKVQQTFQRGAGGGGGACGAVASSSSCSGGSGGCSGGGGCGGGGCGGCGS